MPLELDAQLSELDFLSEKQEGLFRARAALVRRRAATPPGSAEMADIGRQINRIVASIDRVNDRIEFLGPLLHRYKVEALNQAAFRPKAGTENENAPGKINPQQQCHDPAECPIDHV